MQERSAPPTGVTILAAVLLFLATFHPPTLTAATHLDSSWQQVMGHLLKKPALAGVDWVITYGPLGFFQTPAYDRELFWLHCAWAAIASASLTWAALKIFVGISSRIAACLWVLILASSPISDQFYPAGYLLGTFVLIAHYRCHPVGLVISSVLLALLALMKFTQVLFGGVFASAIFLSAMRIRGPVVAMSCAAILPLVFCSIWVLLGNPISNLAPWLRGSLEISAGYAMAQSLPGGTGEVMFALALSIGAAGLVTYSYFRGRRRLEDALLSGAMLVWIFLLFKVGFVRTDNNARFFFAAILLVPYLVEIPRPFPRALKFSFVAIAVAYFGLGAIGEPQFKEVRKVTSAKRLLREPAVKIAGNLRYVLDPFSARARLEEDRRALRNNYALPRIREVVGDSTVDLFGYEQGIVFLNELEYHGRPVFQSYSAYTPTLLQLNAEFIAGADAPAYVLYKLKTIDGRLPTLDDNLAVAILRRDYEVALVEEGFILLRRLPASQRGQIPEGNLAEQRTIAFGQAVEVPSPRGAEIHARIDMNPSKLGTFRTFLYKLPEVYLVLGTSDGEEHRFRFIPGEARSGFLLSPLLEDHASMLRFCSGEDLPTVDWLRVETEMGHHEIYFEAMIGLELRAYDMPVFQRGGCPP